MCGPARWGAALILFFLLAFGGWAGFVPLDGGAVAPGVVNPDSGKKTIQHLEGGIIAELLVREGETVKAGQPLVVLESTQGARRARGAGAATDLAAGAQSALEAERAGLGRIEWPAELRAADPNIKTVLDAQQEVFDTRRQTHASRREILSQRIEQLVHQIRGYEAQVLSASKQIGFVAEELSAKEYLSAAASFPSRRRCGCADRCRDLRQDRRIPGRDRAWPAADRRSAYADAFGRCRARRPDRRRFRKGARELAEVNEKLLASADVVRRTVVPAPVDGTWSTSR